MTIDPSTIRPIEELVDPRWHDGDIPVNGSTLHYYRSGGALPPVVLLHGFMESGLCWLRVAEQLAPRYDVIMLDARAHGRSGGPGALVDLDVLAADTIGAIDALALDRPALIGHSMGGAVATAVAAAAPDRVRAIVLEDPAMRAAPTPKTTDNPQYRAWYDRWYASMLALKTQSLAEQVEATLAMWPPSAPVWHPTDLAGSVDARARFNLDLLDALSPAGLVADDWPALIAAIRCPTLLITGDPRRGSGGTPDVIELFTGAWHDGQHVVFEDAGHFIHRDGPAQFDRFVTLIGAFLERTASTWEGCEADTCSDPADAAGAVRPAA